MSLPWVIEKTCQFNTIQIFKPIDLNFLPFFFALLTPNSWV